MANPNPYSKKRLEFVDQSIQELSAQARQLQRSFWESFLENVMLALTAKGKKIENTDDNLRIINSLAQIIDGDIRPGDGQYFLEWYVGQLDELSGLNQKYFGDTDTVTRFATENRDRLLRLLGYSNGKIKSGSFLYTLIDFSDVYNQLQQILVGSVFTGQPFDLDGTKAFIVGSRTIGLPKPGEPAKATNISGGAIEGALTEKTFDSFQQYDRTLQKGIAEDLGLSYAIYQGGLIKTSREFCIERNDRVFHKDEIEKFGTPEDKFNGYSDKSRGEFDGKTNPYNPFIDCGGHNCRHHLDWISDELAEVLKEEEEGKARVGGKVKKKLEEKPKPKPEIYKEVQTAKEGKRITQAIFHDRTEFKVKSVSYAKSLDAGQINARNKILHDLLGEYTNTYDPSEIKVEFKSTKATFGFIKHSGNRTLNVANFGNKYDPSRANDWDSYKSMSEFLFGAPKSRVDKQNLGVSTTVHEFGHLISIANHRSKSEKINEFWSKMGDLKDEYSKEIFSIRDAIRGENDEEKQAAILEKFRNTFLGQYASTNINEFMAEGFTEYKLRSTPSKYAKRIGELINKYFKK